KRTGPRGLPWSPLALSWRVLLLDDLHGGLRLLSCHVLLPSLARRLGFLHQRGRLLHVVAGASGDLARASLPVLGPRSLHVLASWGLNVLATRSLHVLAPRGLHVLATRSLHILATRSLHVLAARRLHILAARSLHVLATRRLHVLATRSLHVLA